MSPAGTTQAALKRFFKSQTLDWGRQNAGVTEVVKRGNCETVVV
jgi:hypothetical protein